MTLVTEKFLTLARTVAKAKGVSALPIVTLPHNVEFMTDEELKAVAERAFPEVVGCLSSTAPQRPVPA